MNICRNGLSIDPRLWQHLCLRLKATLHGRSERDSYEEIFYFFRCLIGHRHIVLFLKVEVAPVIIFLLDHNTTVVKATNTVTLGIWNSVAMVSLVNLIVWRAKQYLWLWHLFLVHETKVSHRYCWDIHVTHMLRLISQWHHTWCWETCQANFRDFEV